MNFALLKRWHRRTGLLAASFVLLLASTGLCLNHVSSWGFDRKALHSATLLGLYGMAEAGAVVSYPLAAGYVSESNGQLFQDDTEIARCDGAMVGVVRLAAVNPAQIIVACERQLLVFTPAFQLVEKVGSAHGLPAGVRRLGVVAGQLLIDTSDGLVFANLNALSWTPVEEAPKATLWSVVGQASEGLRRALRDKVDREEITYERLLLDLHSGRILGEWGVYLVDVMALLFMLLSVSGIVIWHKSKRWEV